MKFEVEEDLLPFLPNHIDHLRPGVGEELLSYFEHSDAVFEESHPALSFAKCSTSRAKMILSLGSFRAGWDIENGSLQGDTLYL